MPQVFGLVQNISLIVPSGTVMPFSSSITPSGFIFCDGSAISRTVYASLFSAINTLYGVGDGSTTFNIPDCRGIFLRGVGTNGVISASNGSSYNGNLAAYVRDQMQGHHHPDSGHVHGPPPGTSAYVINSSGYALIGGGGQGFSVNSGTGYAAIGNPSTDGSNGTPLTGAQTQPANLSVRYLIKY